MKYKTRADLYNSKNWNTILGMNINQSGDSDDKRKRNNKRNKKRRDERAKNTNKEQYFAKGVKRKISFLQWINFRIRNPKRATQKNERNV